MSNFLRYVRYGFRLLTKDPGFTAVALLALILGIGANTAIFSVVYASLLAPMPYPEPDQLVMVWSSVRGDRNSVSPGDFLEWKQNNKVFQDIVAWNGGSVSLSMPGQTPEQIQTRAISPGSYKMIGTNMTLGREFLPEEGEPGRDHEVIMTNQFWKERFGSDPQIIGKLVRVNGENYTVVGVLEPGQSDRLESKMFTPLSFKPEQKSHENHWILAMARLKPGVTIEQANADMAVVAQHIAEIYPESNKGWGVLVEPLKNDFMDRGTIRSLWMMMGAVAFVLLIACVNVANLLLARGTARQKEVAVRSSLGATRWQLFWQFLVESLTLALTGGALGVAFSWVLLKVILFLVPPNSLPSEADITLNVPVLLFTLAATVLAGVLCGCVPALQTWKTNLIETLKEGGRTSSAGRQGLRRALVVVEFALALSLLAGAGLVIHSFYKLTKVNLGFRQDHLLTFNLPAPEKQFKDADSITLFYRQALEQMRAVPGVSSISASTGMPMQGTNFGMGFTIVGQPPVDRAQRQGAGFNMVTPDYYRVFGVQLTRGRMFTEQDTAGSVPVAIVNMNFVKQYLPAGTDPLTQRVAIDKLIPLKNITGKEVEWQIVGVYENVHNGGVRGEGFPEVDVPFAQSPWPQASIAVRTSGNPSSVTKAIAAVVAGMNPDLPLDSVKTMDQLVGERIAGERFVTILFSIFAGVALLLAAIGIYGVMSFAVAQRTHEIGLRMALGAGTQQVLRLVLREGMLLAFAGLGLGLVGAYFVGKAMQSVLYEIKGNDPTAVGAVSAVLLAAALLASYLPARRATRVDPMVALRDE